MEAITGSPSRSAVIALLRRAGLPTQGVTDELLETFFCVGDPIAPIGIVGLEIAPPYALLRSLAVDPEARSVGIGSQLVAHAEERARARGVHSIYLLTTTAEPYFDHPPSSRDSARRARISWPSISRSNRK